MAPVAQGAPTELGPVSAEEAALLWKDGDSAFESRDYQRAVTLLQRLVDRYPGHVGFLESHRLLGEAYLALSEQEEEKGNSEQARALAIRALPPLRYYSSGSRDFAAAARAKILLGHAFLASGKLHEALLCALEIGKGVPRPPAPVRVQGLLLKTLAQLALKRHGEAERTLSSARRLLNEKEPAPGPLRGETAFVELRFRTDQCARLPSARRMGEAQARTQIARRGACLLEALLTYRTALEAGDPHYARKATRATRLSIEGHVQACLDPPAPLPLKPQDRTPLQLQRYREELVLGLRDDCAKTRRLGAEIVTSWLGADAKVKLPGEGPALALSIAKLLETR